MYGEYHGSNVELEWDAANITRELALRAYLQDEAFRRYQDAMSSIVSRKQDLRFRYGPVLVRMINEYKNVTTAKAMADHECRDTLARLESATAEREVALELLRKLQSQMSAAQTRQKIWQAQFDVEMRGPR